MTLAVYHPSPMLMLPMGKLTDMVIVAVMESNPLNILRFYMVYM